MSGHRQSFGTCFERGCDLADVYLIIASLSKVVFLPSCSTLTSSTESVCAAFGFLENSLIQDNKRWRSSMIGYTVTLPNEKKAQSKETTTHPVKNFLENWYAVP